MVVAQFRDAFVGSEAPEAVDTGNDRFGSVGLDDLPVFVEFCFEIADDFGVGLVVRAGQIRDDRLKRGGQTPQGVRDPHEMPV